MRVEIRDGGFGGEGSNRKWRVRVRSEMADEGENGDGG